LRAHGRRRHRARALRQGAGARWGIGARVGRPRGGAAAEVRADPRIELDPRGTGERPARPGARRAAGHDEHDDGIAARGGWRTRRGDRELPARAGVGAGERRSHPRAGALVRRGRADEGGRGHLPARHRAEAERVDLSIKARELEPADERTTGNDADASRYVAGKQMEVARAYREAAAQAQKQLGVNPRNAELRSRLAMYQVFAGDKRSALRE